MGKKDIPNIITASRIVGALTLLFTTAFSPLFFVVYTYCGFSDVLDGFIARKYKLTSETGAKLDSVADLLFYSVLAIKIMPTLIKILPMWLWCVAIGVVVVRVITYAMVAIKSHKLASLHTYMNKLSGLVIFVLPYFIKSYGFISCVVIGVVTSIATIEEFFIHLFGKDKKAVSN